jgi:hypothetical protein
MYYNPLINKRINYIKTDVTNKSSPPFASIYLCSNILPNKIIFEELRESVKEGKHD